MLDKEFLDLYVFKVIDGIFFVDLRTFKSSLSIPKLLMENGLAVYCAQNTNTMSTFSFK